MKFSALLALCSPFVLHSFAQSRPGKNEGRVPAASAFSPTCTIGLVYCGQTLVNKGWPESLIIGIADGFPRGDQWARDNFRRALIKCGAGYALDEWTPGLTYQKFCDTLCIDGGAGKNDYCAEGGQIQNCTPGLKYCGRTLKYMGYTASKILSDLRRASGGRTWPDAGYIQQMEDWLLECRSNGLWYDSECEFQSCTDAGSGKSDYCTRGFSGRSS